MSVIPKTTQATVVTAGTRVSVVAADTEQVVGIVFSAPSTNTGTVFLGDVTVSSSNGVPIAKGTALNQINAPDGQFLDLKAFNVDAATSGDKLNIFYLKKVN